MATVDGLLDLFADGDGDIAISAGGDLKVVRESEVVAQEVIFRLKTVRGDWQLKPDCGADLELLIGQPNSPQTGARMEAQIARALTHDGFLGGELKTIRAVPVNRDQILGLVQIELGDQIINQTVELDLREGLLS
jgi:phage baseplate assembly protein W